MTVYRVEDVADEIPLDRTPKPKLHVDAVLLRPDLTNKEAEKEWTNKPIDPKTIKYRPTASTYYQTPDGKAKLLFLRGVLDTDIYANAEGHVRHIKGTPAAKSKRTCLRGSPGEEALFGYTDTLNVNSHLRVRQPHPQLTAPSVKQYPQFRGLWPLCWEMEDILREYIPGYWSGRETEQKHGPRSRAEGERNDFFQYSDAHKQAVDYWFHDWSRFWYSIPGSNFTTITWNHNTRFLGHRDSNNATGALSCMAVFGKFAGGELCFPRLGVAIDAKERDMLVCDCPQEMHGTLSTPQGNRYSVVVYTREGLTKSGFKVKKKAKAAGGM